MKALRILQAAVLVGISSLLWPGCTKVDKRKPWLEVVPADLAEIRIETPTRSVVIRNKDLIKYVVASLHTQYKEDSSNEAVGRVFSLIFVGKSGKMQAWLNVTRPSHCVELLVSDEDDDTHLFGKMAEPIPKEIISAIEFLDPVSGSGQRVLQ